MILSHYFQCYIFFGGVHCVRFTDIRGMYYARLQVVARDDDQGSNSKLSYVLFGGNEDSAFTLSDSGELRVTQSLDREAKEHFVLMVTATDSGKTVLTFIGCKEFLPNMSKRKYLCLALCFIFVEIYYCLELQLQLYNL